MNKNSNINLKDVLFCSGDLKTKLAKIADYVLGGLLCAVLRPSRLNIKNTDKVKNILVIRPGGIGDAVLLIPFIKQLKILFPEAALDILCEKRNAGIFRMSEDLAARILLYDTLSGFLQAARGGYDIIFDTEQWHNSSAIFSYLSGGKRRIGFNTRKARSKFYTDLVSYEQEKYEAENFLNLLTPLSPSTPTRCTSPGTPTRCTRDKRIALCLSAGIPERTWPAPNFQKLIDYLAKKGYNILLLGGKKEKRLAQAILKGVAARDNLEDFVDKADLMQTACLLKSSSLYIGLDSGILHLASALGLPIVSLFGPGITEKWAPQGPEHILISKRLDCSPCTLFGYTPRCRKARCMEAITPEDVIKVVEELQTNVHLVGVHGFHYEE